MFRKSMIVLLVAGILATFGLAASALFTSEATVSDNAFATGSLVLTASPTSAAITLSGMAPGDQVTAPISMSNGGTLDLRYALQVSATNTDNKNLADQLVLTIKSGVAQCSNAGFGASGTSVYSGSLSTAAFGNPATGQHAGDRLLSAGTNEVLCFNASLPVDTGNAFQNAATTATFTFSGEQTKNNP
jgi:spore coat-associated protein N